MRRMIFAAAMLAPLAVAAPAMAQGNATFSVGSVNYTAPVPKGYCLPKTDAEKQRVASVAAYDDENLSVLSLIGCGSENADPLNTLVVKVSRSLVNQPMTLSDLLSSPEFANSGMLAPVDDEEMGDIVKRETGMDMSVETSIHILGRDDVCGYLGGVVSVSAGDKVYVTVAGCMTVVGNRTLFVILSAPGSSPATVERLRGKARAFAVSIRTKR